MLQLQLQIRYDNLIPFTHRGRFYPCDRQPTIERDPMRTSEAGRPAACPDVYCSTDGYQRKTISFPLRQYQYYLITKNSETLRGNLAMAFTAVHANDAQKEDIEFMAAGHEPHQCARFWKRQERGSCFGHKASGNCCTIIEL